MIALGWVCVAAFGLLVAGGLVVLALDAAYALWRWGRR